MASFGSMTPQMGNANQVLGATPTLNQVSPGSPAFQPGLLPPSPMAVPQMASQGAPAPQMPSLPGGPQVPNQMPQAPQMPMGQPAPQPNVMGQPMGNPEAAMIIKSLSKRLDSLTKGEEMARGQQ